MLFEWLPHLYHQHGSGDNFWILAPTWCGIWFCDVPDGWKVLVRGSRGGLRLARYFWSPLRLSVLDILAHL